MSHSFPAKLAAMAFAACLPATVPAETRGGEPSPPQSALSFQHVVVDDQPPRNPWTKLAGDFNGDGKLDIAIAGQNGPLVWYVNPGWQKVQVAERGWNTVGGAVGDVDGDGDADIVPGAQVWFENPRPKGDPTKDPWRLHRISDIGSHDVALVDLDRDGRPHLVARDQSSFGHKTGNKIHVWRQVGLNEWSHRAVDCPHGEGLAVADLDGDGDGDVVIGGRWFENDGRVDGEWRPHIFTTNWVWADTKVALGDLNGDGHLDVVLAPAELQGQRYRLAWYEAPRDAARPDWPEHIVEAPVEAVMHGLAVADMDGDGQQDMVTARMHQGAPPQEVSVYLNTGRGNSWKKVTVSERGSHDILVVDFNGDGRPDILGANHGGSHQPVELWLSQLSKRAASGPLRVHPTNPRYFTDGTTDAAGSLRAVYLTGSHTWNSLQDVTGKEWFLPNLISTQGFEAYLDFLVAHHHNFIRLWTIEHAWSEKSGARIAPHPWLRTGPGNALDGRPRFDLSQFDSAYFERLRARVIAARDRGFYVSVMLFGGMWGTEHKDTWAGHPFNGANNINGLDADLDHDGTGNELYTLRVPAALALQKATGTKVVETLNDLDNVLYEVANEVREYSTAWQYEIIRHVKAIEARQPKQHPVGMTGYNSIPHEDLLKSPADWISPSNSGGDYRNNPPAADGKKVIVTDTDHLWGEGGNPAWVWKSFTRGLQPIWMERVKLAAGDLPQAEAIRQAMGHARRLAEGVKLAALVPHSELASTRYCLAHPGQEYIVYLPDGGELTVDLSATSAPLAVEWIHPVSGTSRQSDAVAGGGKRSFKAPFAGDIVLYLSPIQEKPSRAAVRIWVVDDGVRINPQTGQAFEENAIYPAALRLKPGYRQRNWVFHGDKEVALAGAQNEMVAFQVQIESETPLRNVSVEVSNLRGPAPFRSADSVRLFKEWYVEVKQASHEGASAAGFDCLGLGWYPDALIPLDAGVNAEFGMPFDLPDRTNAVPGQKVQGIWVDVFIPPDQAPGTYEGAIEVTGQAGVESVRESLRLRLEVFPFALPQQNHLGISLNDYGSISPRRMSREKLWAFYQLCHAHRCVLDVLYNAPKATGAGDALRLDWMEYDAAFGPLFDGSAFTAARGYRGPGEGVPVPRFYLPFETSGGWAWPLSAEGMETEPYETAVKKALREFERHFLEKGWTRTKLMMFYNRYDESGRVKEISYFARLLREAGLHEPGRFLYRVDGGPPAVVRGVGLEHVGIWCINGNVRYTHVAEQQEIIRHGGQIWVYSSNSAREPCIGAPYLDTEALALRTWGWIPWKYRDSVSTMCEWGTFYHGNLKRWRDPSLAAALAGKQVLNGDALLIYPGEFVGLDQPIPSIRLKMLRRGSQDYEYLWLMARATRDPAAADEIANRVLFRAMHEALKPGQDYWKPGERDSRSHDPEQWDAARRRLAERIMAATK